MKRVISRTNLKSNWQDLITSSFFPVLVIMIALLFNVEIITVPSVLYFSLQEHGDLGGLPLYLLPTVNYRSRCFWVPFQVQFIIHILHNGLIPAATCLHASLHFKTHKTLWSSLHWLVGPWAFFSRHPALRFTGFHRHVALRSRIEWRQKRCQTNHTS